MSTRLPMLPDRSGSDWPAVAVAFGILSLLGAVIVTAIVRWSAADVRDLVGASLGPIIGVVSGAFVTYFFTRQASAAAANVAQTATTVAAQEAQSSRAELQSRGKELTGQAQRSQALHNALTTVLAMATPQDTVRMMQDPVVSAALNSHRTAAGPGTP